MVTTVKLFVEGAGKGDQHTQQLQTKAREALHKLLKSYGIDKMPRIVVCGGRAQTYDAFVNCRDATPIVLLDSEKPVDNGKYMNRPWDFLKSVETWNWRDKLDNSKCHLMVQCMEAWLLADYALLETYYGKGFNVKKIPSNSDVEMLSKDSIGKDGAGNCISKAASTCCGSKTNYDKGRDSFDILMRADAKRIAQASPWAKRFFDYVKDLMK